MNNSGNEIACAGFVPERHQKRVKIDEIERNRNYKQFTVRRYPAMQYIRFQGAAKKAGDEGRTRDKQLGRLLLYQLSYSRNCTKI